MKFIRKIIFLLFGKKAYTKHSKGRLIGTTYFVIEGIVNEGDLVMFRYGKEAKCKEQIGYLK